MGRTVPLQAKPSDITKNVKHGHIVWGLGNRGENKSTFPMTSRRNPPSVCASLWHQLPQLPSSTRNTGYTGYLHNQSLLKFSHTTPFSAHSLLLLLQESLATPQDPSTSGFHLIERKKVGQEEKLQCIIPLLYKEGRNLNVIAVVFLVGVNIKATLNSFGDNIHQNINYL